MKTISFTNKTVENILIFSFEGTFSEENADKVFISVYNAIGDFSNKSIIFNLSKLDELDQESIGYIADIFSNIEDSNGQFYITDMNSSVYDRLEGVGLLFLTDTAPTEADAIEEIKSKR